ncbi:MAG: bifunctional folylpolyglutamate synthase/dihydrofolate synthase [Caldimicrobium sp.]
MILKNYLEWLNQHQFHGIKPGLHRIIRLLKKLGNPHKNYPTLHIAGTNGKGSTCAILNALLKEHGLKTGLYTSPHLFKLNERFKINSQDISDEDLFEMLKTLKKYVEEPITYFELTTALAFLYFSVQKVDIAVIETGLGGRLDATNVIHPEVSIITSIGLDHTKYLGKTLENIAFEKAGIIKRNRPVVIGKIEEKPLKVILERAKILSSKTFLLDKDFKIYLKENFWNYEGKYTFKNLELSLKGPFQGRNLSLSLKTLEILEDNYFLRIQEDKIRKALKTIEWEGRYKKIFYQNKEILIDCAHNLEGIKTLKEALLQEKFYPFILLFGATNEDGEKPYLSLLEELSSLATDIFISEFPAERKVVTLEEWKEAVKNKPFRVSLFESPLFALESAIHHQGSKKILITGSIYFVAEILKIIQKNFHAF